MEAVPLVMRIIRAEMRSHRTPDLSVPQFRALGYLGRNPGCSLSDVAEHIGLTLPTISKLVDRLEAAEMVTRGDVSGDRRRLALRLTPRGEAALQAAASATRTRLAEMIAALSPNDRAQISAAMSTLLALFGPAGGTPPIQSDKED